jgi:hypothetical protein
VRRALTILLLITGWIVPLAIPHAGEDDRLCIPAYDRTDGAKVRPDATVHETAPDHCAICHSARAFRTGITQSAFVLVNLSPGDLLTALDSSALVVSARFRLPARAPPSA